MNVKTGDILTEEQARQCTKMLKDLGLSANHIKPMSLHPTTTQLRRTPVIRGIGRVGRNEPCPCGSGKKFKKCCMEV